MPPSPVYYVPAAASPFVPHQVGPPPVFFPTPVDPQHDALVKQIDYYFRYLSDFDIRQVQIMYWNLQVYVIAQKLNLSIHILMSRL
jgi:hypothetical protein